MTMDDLARDKLRRAFSEDEADRIVADALKKIGLDRLETPDDLLAFGTYLTAQEGLVGIIGGSLRVQARVHGAAGD